VVTQARQPLWTFLGRGHRRGENAKGRNQFRFEARFPTTRYAVPEPEGGAREPSLTV
jgi:hypothetical protein